MKGLIGITPSGAVSFISELYGGIRQLFIESGLLEILEEGDSVMADKGFTVADILSVRGISLPPMKLADQFDETELVETRRIASLRIHVERAMKRIKEYKILRLIPNNMVAIASHLFYVCAFLSNFQCPLVTCK